MKWTILFCLLFLHLVNAKTEHFHDIDGDGNLDHDPTYDKEQFLGDEADSYTNLSNEDKVKKLMQLVDEKVDTNKDGSISKEELKAWLLRVQHEQQQKEIDKTWSELNMTDASRLTWDDYAASMIPEKMKANIADAALKNQIKEAVDAARSASGIDSTGIKVTLPKETFSEDDQLNADDFTQRLAKDTRRWKAADTDGDGFLNKEEFGMFTYPDQHEQMKNILTTEAIESLDKDKDGKVSEEEYLKDMWSPDKDEKEQPTPEWLKEESKTFKEKRDANKDGQLDHDEIKAWMFPPEDKDSQDASAEEEAAHLIKEADEDHDGSLSKEEITKHFDVFAGSGVTNYGDEIGHHDEL